MSNSVKTERLKFYLWKIMYWVYNLIRAVFFSKFERSKPHELNYKPNKTRCPVKAADAITEH